MVKESLVRKVFDRKSLFLFISFFIFHKELVNFFPFILREKHSVLHFLARDLTMCKILDF